MLANINEEGQEAYRERIIRYVDSIFCEAMPKGVMPTSRHSGG